MGLFGGRKTHFVDADILVVGGGMAGCGATYESRYWGRDLKIVCVEKANIERSGAVAQGLYAINCYMGMQWGENQPEDHVRYARNDLMGLVREDLGYDIARHVDSTVHKFEEWGLPIMRDPKTGRYQREGKWQIMIHGESYKPIVAEAARKAATEVYNRIMVTHLLTDDKANRVSGAVGFNVRTGDFYVFRAKAVIVAAGGASHIFKPRAVGEGMGRTWYAPWSSASAYALPIQVGAKMTQMENRIVLTRFKDGYGPVGAYFLHLKTYTQNGLGEEYEKRWYDDTKALVGDYIDRQLYDRLTEKYPGAKFSEPLVRRYKEEHGFVGENGSRVVVKVPVGAKFVDHDITNDLQHACERVLPSIVETAIDLIGRYEPEFQEQVRRHIYLAGGGSQIKGIAAELEHAFREYGSFKVSVVEDPLFAGADGALALAQDMPEEYWEEM